MTVENDPTIVRATPEQIDPYWLEENLTRQESLLKKNLPARFRDAVANEPEVVKWVKAVVQTALDARRQVPRILSGPSLLLLGPTGTGKTFQAYGAIRALSMSGVGVSWMVVTAADFYASLRPRPGVDSESEFRKVADIDLLVLDDLGAAKDSEWNEEINYRLINHRYEQELPTIITTNVPPRQLSEKLGERVTSRLIEMCARVVLRGPDRRQEGKA